MSDTSAQYEHKQEAVQRPDVGVQDQFSVKKPNRVYTYDSSLDPALSWDENRERELGEWLIGLVARCADEGEDAVFQSPQLWKGGGIQVQTLKAAAALLQTISQPFLNWSGKAERHQLSVPTTPLFVHERHSTKAILDGIKSRKAKGTNLDLFGDPQLDVSDRLDAYEHRGPWQNRMILGDSLQVMNSLLEFEGLGGQVQMVYIDPPYGVKFGSNFQPFVRKQNVKHGPDDHMTREPEMVKAYRDTWELGVHSYLSYLRDRLMLSKELLHVSGSIFVQISDENIHHVREVLDEVFGAENAVSLITFAKTASTTGNLLSDESDYLLWYAKDKARVKYRQLYLPKNSSTFKSYKYAVSPDAASVRALTREEKESPALLPEGWRVAQLSFAVSQDAGKPEERFYKFKDRAYDCGAHRHWKTTNPAGLDNLSKARRLIGLGSQLNYIRYVEDFAATPLTNSWGDTGSAGFSNADPKVYVVQTDRLVIQRCMLMTTEPGDLVFDPTCGSGTTAYTAEYWGRRWITCDTSRVPLALARQRLLTATFPYYDLKDPKLGPAGGFVYQRKQNRKGEEVGGLLPHITLKSIANDEPPAMEVLVDRPDERKDVVRVAGPFVVEATIAPAQRMEASDSATQAQRDGAGLTVNGPVTDYGDAATHIERMTQVLRQSKTLHLPGNRELVLEQIRRTSDSDVLHAEATDADGKRMAIVFGPESGAISADTVFEAAREAHFLRYDQLYFFAFAIQAKARELIEERNKDGAPKLRIHCTYVAVTPDVAMSDLLKTTRASEIFSVTGLPDVKLTKLPQKNNAGETLCQVEVRGLDIFNPANLKHESVEGENLPCWMLDSDYDPSGSFYATQVFFPKTSAWDNLQKSLKADFDESVWSHLAGTTSEPFVLGERRRVAVKVIDERGNELMRVIENIA
ncbi:site-specific DNA-methyltransferase [Achromobacter mucicolens]|uniref:site-specific DNA-methyltransferase n=1 Tax=Achromobacter mucicolens TaxID=1389922 RepID=UPI00244D265A|nr:site-specific DNA-methyltransferase [Achromobacter mucicolens]MDG9970242.1 site-specific DNA-methyltransferase [Achromobacter mucicolens]